MLSRKSSGIVELVAATSRFGFDHELKQPLLHPNAKSVSICISLGQHDESNRRGDTDCNRCALDRVANRDKDGVWPRQYRRRDRVHHQQHVPVAVLQSGTGTVAGAGRTCAVGRVDCQCRVRSTGGELVGPQAIPIRPTPSVHVRGDPAGRSLLCRRLSSADALRQQRPTGLACRHEHASAAGDDPVPHASFGARRRAID